MLAATVVCLLGIVSAHAQQSVADFYKGKQLRFVIRSEPGGGYDIYSRLIGSHIVRHIPGNPTFIPQNMPGAGSIKATDYTVNVAPKDGTAFTLAMPGALIEPLTGDPAKFRYNPMKIAYIGTMDSGTRMCMTRPGSKIRTMADARASPTIMAARRTLSAVIWRSDESEAGMPKNTASPKIR